MMNYCYKILSKIKKYINQFGILKIRTNLIIIFGLYSCFLLVTLFLYGYLNLTKVVDFEKQSKVNDVYHNLKYTALNIKGMEDIHSIKGEILKSEMLDDGDFILVDHDRNVVFSSDPQKTQIAGVENLIKKLNNSSGIIQNCSLENSKKYIFYEKINGNNTILLYTVPVKYFQDYHFPVVNFIVFSSILCLFVYFVIIIILKNRVYNPIVNVEKVIHGIVEGDIDLEAKSIEENSTLYPIYSDLNIMIGRVKDLILREHTAKMMKKQAELDTLQSQINPHFLYNTLESIRGQAITNGMEDIEIMTKALSDLFRYSISKKGNFVTLEEELRNVDNYLMIQQYRFNNKFILINEVDVDCLKCKIPKLLIQPIIENAIHHGLETKVGKGTLTMKAYATTKRLVVNIQDDGLGISHDKLLEINETLIKGQNDIETKDSSLRIGLINVNERIKMNYGQEYGLRVYSSKGVGTNVEVVLPVIYE